MRLFGRKPVPEIPKEKSELIMMDEVALKITAAPTGNNVIIQPEEAAEDLTPARLAQLRAMNSLIKNLEQTFELNFSANMQGGYLLSSDVTVNHDRTKDYITFDGVAAAAKAFAPTYIDDATIDQEVNPPVNIHAERLAANKAARPLRVVKDYFAQQGKPLDGATLDGLRAALQKEYASDKGNGR